MLPESTEQVVPTTRLVFSSTVSRHRGRGRSLLASFRPPVATISSSSSGGVPDLNRSVRERPTAVTRERESKLPLDLLSLVLSELIARANIATRSILGRKIGTWARRYTTTATATAQPQSQNATQRDQTDKERGRKRRRKAPSISPSSAPALPAALSVHSAATAPRAPPYGRGKARRHTRAAPRRRRHAATAAPAPALP